MSNASILFQFEDQQSASLAFDTLQELGYEPAFHEGEQQPALHIHVEQSDITSALEIAQAHGGRLMDEQHAATDAEYYSMAYNLDQINIPAHVVNEDWPEEYANVSGAMLTNSDAGFQESDTLYS